MDLKDKVMAEWRKLCNGQLHNLYSSQNMIRQIKSVRMRWAVHVESVGKDRKVYKVWWESPKERDH
jgi:hypothetical protein